MGTRAHQTKAVERLLSWLQQREDQMAALLADLIAIPTENPPGRQYREFIEVLEKQTERLGLEFRRLEPPSPGMTFRSVFRRAMGKEHRSISMDTMT
jgi:acetylornithine deacetylase/succinyl-diaminopimelate desuccinylase-like protein